MMHDFRINPSFMLRFYTFDLSIINDTISLNANPLKNLTEHINRRVKEVKIQKSYSTREDFYFIVLTKSDITYDSVLFYYGIEFKSVNNATMVRYKIISGVPLNFDEFKVNSIMFIRNSHYLAMSVDNLGIILYDLIRFELADIINFSKVFTQFNAKCIITNIIPIANNGMRVLMKDHGSFSLFWDEVVDSKVNGDILTNISQNHRFKKIKNQISTGIVDYSDLSIVEVIYYLRKGGYYDGFIRVYNHMNHNNSKSYKEYNIGRVSNCSYVNLQ